MIEIIKGMYRKYETMELFWPCLNGNPHVMVYSEGQKDEISRALRDKSFKYIVIEGIVTNEEKFGQDGTIYVRRIIEEANGKDCTS